MKAALDIYRSIWDANSNRTSDEAGTHSFNSADQPTDTGFAYDANGNQTSSPTYPSASYNGIEQTTSITASGQAPAAMSYAAMGQAERTISPAGTAQNGAMGVQTETLGGQTSSYIRDGAGALVYLKSSAGDFYYYFDGLGSVVGLIDATTGDQRADYSYDPFGSHATAVGVNGALPANPWRWMGGYLDGTGLYHFGERYYDPAMGRFLQTDPIMGGSCNAYDYACGDPINFSDLSGTKVSVGRFGAFIVKNGWQISGYAVSAFCIATAVTAGVGCLAAAAALTVAKTYASYTQKGWSGEFAKDALWNVSTGYLMALPGIAVASKTGKAAFMAFSVGKRAGIAAGLEGPSSLCNGIPRCASPGIPSK